MNNWIPIVYFLPLEALRGQFRGCWYALFPPLAEICSGFKLFHLKANAVTRGLQGLTVLYSLPEERKEEGQILHLDYLLKSLWFFQPFDIRCYFITSELWLYYVASFVIFTSCLFTECMWRNRGNRKQLSRNRVPSCPQSSCISAPTPICSSLWPFFLR